MDKDIETLSTLAPAIVLVKPQLGENIGMVARAMLNNGLTDLRLVAPRDGWPNAAADSASSGALNKGVTVTLYGETAQAVEDMQYVLATTARPRDMIKEVYTPEAAIDETCAQALSGGNRTAILFGGERSGLENEDIALSNAIITAPLNPAFTSLNLAQAVLMIGYEWSKRIYGAQVMPTEFKKGDTPFARREEIDGLITRLTEELDAHHFFRSEGLKPTVTRNLTNMFSRMQITAQEVNTFHGIISALTGQKPPRSDHKGE